MSEQTGSLTPAEPGVARIRKKSGKRFWIPVLLVAGLAGTVAVLLPRRADPPPSVPVSVIPQKTLGVGCRGRIEPEDGVILVAAPYFSGQPSLIRELRVKEGDWVKSGQVVGILDGWDALEKARLQSEADVEVARRKLAQVKAGSKQADIDAQKMEIARWETEYQIAGSDHRRYEGLFENQVASAYDLDQRRLAMDRARRTLDAARERLKSLEEVRKEDVDVLSAQLAAAEAQVEHARVELERMVVRAPANGRVLKIHAYPGEEVGSQGILELGRTDRMYVIAEVYESDIRRVRIGQKADISGDLAPEGLTGEVTQVGSQVTKSELLPMDPAAYADTRVVKVKIQLQNGERVAGLIYGKVDVVIRP